MSSGVYLAIGLGLLLVMLTYEWVKARNHPGQPYDLHEAIALYVKAAEMLLPGQTGADKLVWVVARIDALFPEVDEEWVRTVIESVVYDVKRAQGR